MAVREITSGPREIPQEPAERLMSLHYSKIFKPVLFDFENSIEDINN